MPTEFEELRLTVTLVDNMSAGLANVRAMAKQITSGPTASALVNFNKMADESSKKIANLSKDALGLGKTFENLKDLINPTTLALGAVGYELVRLNRSLSEHADKLTQIGNKAKLAATSYSDFKN